MRRIPALLLFLVFFVSAGARRNCREGEVRRVRNETCVICVCNNWLLAKCDDLIDAGLSEDWTDICRE